MISVLNLQRERNYSFSKNIYKKVDRRDVNLHQGQTTLVNHARKEERNRHHRYKYKLEAQNKRLIYIINRQLSIRKNALKLEKLEWH